MSVSSALVPALRESPPGKSPLWSSHQLADRAVGALVAEAVLSPKPALVDRRGPGAHDDLDLQRLLRSAAALRTPFEQMAECASGRSPTLSLREELGNIGRNAEEAMLAATAGSNAHRGAIWILGLLIAGRAIVGEDAKPSAVAETAGVIARLPDRFSPAIPSNGARVCQRYGVAGARGEAQAGFPHVVSIGLPTLWSARERGVEETYARLDGLIAIMAHLPDTCLLHRGGWAALGAARAGASAVMNCGGTSTGAGRHALCALENALLARWVSPGGSADLLAACLFLDEQPLFDEMDEVRVSWSN